MTASGKGATSYHRDLKQGTAKNAKNAKSLPDEAFHRSIRSAIWI